MSRHVDPDDLIWELEAVAKHASAAARDLNLILRSGRLTDEQHERCRPLTAQFESIAELLRPNEHNN